MADIVNRASKIFRVLKRRWFKPAVYTLAASFVLYITISNMVIQKKAIDNEVPRFLISRISEDFEETEYTHLLLTIQELDTIPHINRMLKEFANAHFPAPCPDLLKYQLNRMNWEPQAFLIRVKKFFKMYDAYDKIARLDETINFLEAELEQNLLPKSMESQINVLKKERDSLVESGLSSHEYKFMKQYAGIIQNLKNND